MDWSYLWFNSQFHQLSMAFNQDTEVDEANLPELSPVSFPPHHGELIHNKTDGPLDRMAVSFPSSQHGELTDEKVSLPSSEHGELKEGAVSFPSFSQRGEQNGPPAFIDEDKIAEDHHQLDEEKEERETTPLKVNQ